MPQNRPPTFDHLKKLSPPTKRVTFQSDPDDEGSAVTVVIRSIGRKAWSDLLGEYPATAEQRAKVKEILGDDAAEDDLGYDVDRFPAAAVSACLVEPKLTVEQVDELFDAWNLSDSTTLFAAVLEVNTRSRVVDSGKGSGPTPTTGSG